MAGRKLDVLYVGENAQDSTAQPDTTQQASCATLTQDNHVFAAVSPSFSTDSFRACLQKAAVPYVEDSWTHWDATNKATNRSYFNPSNPEPARSQTVLVSSLVKRGWFGAKPVIGVVAAASPTRDRAVDRVQRALVDHGLKADSVQRPANDYSGAVLQFQAAWVTHLFSVEGSGGVETTLFMNQAESQDLRPVYALNTQSGPDFLRANAPAAQLKGAAGVGWSPTVDLGAQGYTPRDAACLKIIHDAGLATADSTAAKFALATCDVFFFFKAAMEKTASAGQSYGAFIAAADSLGGSYVPTGSFESWFGPNRHDGTSAMRPLSYVESCSCIRYQGALYKSG